MPSGLLVRIAAGDRAAVEECFQSYKGVIWTIARQFSSNRAEAEELVQEILIDVWRHASRFDEQVATESTFVTMIARRRSIDFRRKDRRKIPTSQISNDLWVCPAAGDPLVAKEEGKLARAQLVQLKATERKVIELAIDEGLSHAEIAKVLDLPLGTVKTSARAGMIRLRQLFRRDPHKP